jgi:tetratricopeptide (TPR) repeat protein
MGEGGEGGKPGKDGIDVLTYKRGFLSKQVVRKNKYSTEIKNKDSWFESQREPEPQQRKQEFDLEQTVNQERQQLLNCGKAAVSVSLKPKAVAQRHSAISIDTVKQTFLTIKDSELVQDQLFVSREMNLFFEAISVTSRNNEYAADDQIDQAYMQHAERVTNRVTALQLEVQQQRQTRQQQQQTQMEEQMLEEMERIVDVSRSYQVDSDNATSASPGSPDVLADQPSRALEGSFKLTRFGDMSTFYDTQVLLATELLKNTHRNWVTRLVQIPGLTDARFNTLHPVADDTSSRTTFADAGQGVLHVDGPSHLEHMQSSGAVNQLSLQQFLVGQFNALEASFANCETFDNLVFDASLFVDCIAQSFKGYCDRPVETLSSSCNSNIVGTASAPPVDDVFPIGSHGPISDSQLLVNNLYKQPIQKWLPVLRSVDQCTVMVRGWVARLSPLTLSSLSSSCCDFHKAYITKQWLVEQGLGIVEVNRILDSLTNCRFKALYAATGPPFDGVIQQEDMAQKLFIDRDKCQEALNDFNVQQQLEEVSLRNKPKSLHTTFKVLLGIRKSIHCAIVSIQGRHALQLLFHALDTYVTLEELHLLEPVEFYFEIILLLAQLPAEGKHLAAVVQLLMASSCDSWPNLLRSFLLKLSLMNSLAFIMQCKKNLQHKNVQVRGHLQLSRPLPSLTSTDGFIMVGTAENSHDNSPKITDEMALLEKDETESSFLKVVCYLDRIQAAFGIITAKKIESMVRLVSSFEQLQSCIRVFALLFSPEVTAGRAARLAGMMAVTRVKNWEARESEIARHEDRQTQEELALADLIAALQCDSRNLDLKGVNLNDIESDINRIQARFKEFVLMSEAQVKSMFFQRKDEFATCLGLNSYASMRAFLSGYAFVDILATISFVVYMRQSCRLRNSQLLAVLLSLRSGEYKGSLLEISTGEGKSLIVVVLALLRALAGKFVDVLTSSNVLAMRDAARMKPIFLFFGIHADHNCYTDTKKRIKAYHKRVVYGETGTFQRDFLLDRYHGCSIRGSRGFEAAIIDEVDSMFLDKGDQMLYLSQAIPGMELLECVFVYIWIAVNGPDFKNGYYPKNDCAKVKTFLEQQIANGDIRYPRFLDKFVRHRLETWIYSAFVAKGSLNKNDAYRLASSEQGVVLMDTSTGVQMKSAHLSEGIHQFLQLKHLQRFKPETLKSVFVSNTSYFRMYKNLSGLSGTLGSDVECNVLSQVYGISVTFVPSFKHSQRVQHPAIVKQTTLERNAAVVQVANAMKTARRPVLIINKSIAEVLQLSEFFKDNGVEHKKYTTDDESFPELAVAGDIILSTNLAGRGTDIVLNKTEEAAGGLHVILTFVPDNLRIERQAFGRAARKGERGSGQFVIQSSFEQHAQVPPQTTTEAQVPPQTTTEAQVPPQTTTEAQVPPQTTTEAQVPPQTTTEAQVPPQTTTEAQIPLQATAETQIPFHATAEAQKPVLEVISVDDQLPLEITPLEMLLFNRNAVERLRLYRLATYRLRQIRLEEGLLKEFYEKLVQRVSRMQVSGNQQFRDFVMLKLQENGLELFAFWLDEQKLTIQEIKEKGQESTVQSSFAQFLTVCGISGTESSSANNSLVYSKFNNFHYLVQLGRFLLGKKNYSEATTVFDLVKKLEPDFCELADYYSSMCIVNKNQHQFQKAINCLIRARYMLHERIGKLSNYSSLMEQVRKCTMKQGQGLQSDLYAQQLENKMSILYSIVSSIDTAVGNLHNDLEAVASVHIASEDMRLKILERLRSSKLYTEHCVIKEFNYTEERILTILKFTEQSVSVIANIADILLSNTVLKAEMFESVIGHSDDLLGLLVQHNIVQVCESNWTNINENLMTSLKNELQKEAPEGEQEHEGALVLCGSNLYSLHCFPPESIDTTNTVSTTVKNFSLSRPQTVDKTKTLTCKFQYRSLPDSGQISAASLPPVIQFEAAYRFMDMQAASAFWMVQIRDEDLRAWAGKSVRLLLNDARTSTIPLARDGTCLQCTTVTAFDTVQYIMKVKLKRRSSGDSSNAVADSQVNALPEITQVTWILDFKTSSLINFCAEGSIALSGLEMQAQIKYEVLRGERVKLAIESLFQSVDFSSKYTNVEPIRKFLLESSKLPPVVLATSVEAAHEESKESTATQHSKPLENVVFSKGDLQLHDKEVACAKLMQQLQGWLLVQPRVLNSRLPSHEWKQLIKDALSCVQEEPVRRRIFSDLKPIIEGALKQDKGTILNNYSGGSDGTLVATTKSLVNEMQDKFNFSILDELQSMAHLGVDSIVEFKNEPFWWGPFLVILLGVVQIILGACLTAIGMPNIGAALISEGVGDIMFGIEAYISGNFSFKAYLEHKLISVALSVLSCGVGAWCNKGVSIARAGFKAVIKKVGKKILEAGVHALVGIGLDKAMDLVVRQIVESVVEQYVKHVQPGFASIVANLGILYDRCESRQAVVNFMNKICEDFFDVKSIGDKVQQYCSQVVSAIATGLGNALKQRKTNMAGFSALQAFVKAMSVAIKVSNIAVNVIRACSEMALFVLRAGNKIDLELQKVGSNAESIRETRTGVTSNKAFIKEAVDGWSKLIKESMTNYVHNGILKPSVRQVVNGWLKNVGNKMKDAVFPKDFMVDTARQKYLDEAREKNADKLAKTDKLFGSQNKQRTASQMLPQSGVKTIFPADNALCSNMDGYTVGEIKANLGAGVFYEIQEGGTTRIVFVAPSLFKSAIGDKVAQAYHSSFPGYSLQEGVDCFTRRNSDGTAHRVAKLPDGTLVDIPPLSTGGDFCDEQVRLFNAKLRQIGGPEAVYTQENIDAALVYAQDRREVYGLRQKVLNAAPDIVRNQLGDNIGFAIGVSKLPPIASKIDHERQFKTENNERSLRQALDGWVDPDPHASQEIKDARKNTIEVMMGRGAREIYNMCAADQGEKLPEMDRALAQQAGVLNTPAASLALHHIVQEKFIRESLSKLTRADLQTYYDNLDPSSQARIHYVVNAYNVPYQQALLTNICYDPANVRLGPNACIRSDDPQQRGGAGGEVDAALLRPGSGNRQRVLDMVQSGQPITKILTTMRKSMASSQPIFKLDPRTNKFYVDGYKGVSPSDYQPGGKVYTFKGFNPTTGKFSHDLNNFFAEKFQLRSNR